MPRRFYNTSTTYCFDRGGHGGVRVIFRGYASWEHESREGTALKVAQPVNEARSRQRRFIEIDDYGWQLEFLTPYASPRPTAYNNPEY